jgi:hypothetical protein
MGVGATPPVVAPAVVPPTVPPPVVVMPLVVAPVVAPVVGAAVVVVVVGPVVCAWGAPTKENWTTIVAMAASGNTFQRFRIRVSIC